MKKRNSREGFTLLEAITVMAILGILSTLAIASMKVQARAALLRSAIEMITADIRLARVTARTGAESLFIDFEPLTNSYTINGARFVKLPEGVWFGSDPSVSGKPSQPSEAPPADGVSFESDGVKNRAHFYPKGTVIPTGALYVTNGRETLAITVSLSGKTKVWRACGGKKWESF